MHDCVLNHTVFPVFPGGYIVVVLRELVLYQVDEYIDELEPVMQSHHDSGAWNWLERAFIPDYAPDTNGRFYTFKINHKKE